MFQIGGELAFPAHAGMNRSFIGSDIVATGVPRTRGDEPGMIEYAAEMFRRSPHTRG